MAVPGVLGDGDGIAFGWKWSDLLYFGVNYRQRSLAGYFDAASVCSYFLNIDQQRFADLQYGIDRRQHVYVS